MFFKVLTPAHLEEKDSSIVLRSLISTGSWMVVRLSNPLLTLPLYFLFCLRRFILVLLAGGIIAPFQPRPKLN